MSSRRPPLPNFIIVGTQKGATRWLRHNLGQHPDVFTAEGEPSFFDTFRYEQGLDAYRKIFADWDSQPHVGEATPSYMMIRRNPERVARRIEESIPEARLFAILRDPVERTYSAYVHHVKRGRIPKDVSLIDYLESVPPERDRLSLISGSWYASGLEPFVRRFGDRLLVLRTEDAKTEPEVLYGRALEHLGADTAFVPPRLRRIRHSNELPKRSTMSTDEGRRPLTSSERDYIYERVEDEIFRLEGLLECSFAAWRRDAGGTSDATSRAGGGGAAHVV